MVRIVRCSRCGKEHDLGQIEPSFSRPDAYFSVPSAERERRINESDDACLITSQDGQHLACFIRAVLYVPILGEETTIGWGLWVEVNHRAYWRVGSVWMTPIKAQNRHSPVRWPTTSQTTRVPKDWRGSSDSPACVRAQHSHSPPTPNTRSRSRRARRACRASFRVAFLVCPLIEGRLTSQSSGPPTA